MSTLETIADLAKTIGVPFTLLFFLLYRMDHYVDRLLNHVEDMCNTIKKVHEEIKLLKYYLHIKELDDESRHARNP